MIFINMEDFEKKYSLLVSYMLPSVNKCIKSVEFDGFVSGRESMMIDNPKDDFEREMNNRFSVYLTPKINVEVIDKCLGWTPFVMGLKGDIVGKMEELHKTYFPDRKINTNIRYINLTSSN